MGCTTSHIQDTLSLITLSIRQASKVPRYVQGSGRSGAKAPPRRRGLQMGWPPSGASVSLSHPPRLTSTDKTPCEPQALGPSRMYQIIILRLRSSCSSRSNSRRSSLNRTADFSSCDTDGSMLRLRQGARAKANCCEADLPNGPTNLSCIFLLGILSVRFLYCRVRLFRCGMVRSRRGGRLEVSEHRLWDIVVIGICRTCRDACGHTISLSPCTNRLS